MIEITNDTVRTGLTALVAEFGEDFVYTRVSGEFGTRCVYVKDGQPDCIVGKFLAAQGVPVDRLSKADRQFVTPSANVLLGQLVDEGVLTIGKRAQQALTEAQYIQDQGGPHCTWGAALKSALKYLR